MASSKRMCAVPWIWLPRNVLTCGQNGYLVHNPSPCSSKEPPVTANWCKGSLPEQHPTRNHIYMSTRRVWKWDWPSVSIDQNSVWPKTSWTWMESSAWWKTQDTYISTPTYGSLHIYLVQWRRFWDNDSLGWWFTPLHNIWWNDGSYEKHITLQMANNWPGRTNQNYWYRN